MEQSYIRFDWAIKRLLRDKANFGVLEGFLTCLLGRPIKIERLLESEGNQEYAEDKQNRVDLLAEDADGSIILVEVQTTTSSVYFHRMLYGTSKLITEYIMRGEDYGHIRKVYSVNVVYFPLGTGTDYVYHGTTEFRGLHDNDLLGLTRMQQERFGARAVSDIYPEYFLLKVNDFNKVATTPLDEWMSFLKTSCIREKDTAPGLAEARQKLVETQMSREEQAAYLRHLDRELLAEDAQKTSRMEGVLAGRDEMRREAVERMVAAGIPQAEAERIMNDEK